MLGIGCVLFFLQETPTKTKINKKIRIFTLPYWNDKIMKLRTFLQLFVLCGLFIFGAGSVTSSYAQDGSVAKAEKTIAKRRKKEAKAAKKEAKKSKKAFWDKQSKAAKKSVKRNAKRQKRAKRQSNGW